jgi:hypothetical protein
VSNNPRIAAFPLVLAGGADGRTLIAAETPLRRLNYFDGKFLRADDLRLEQDYLRALVAHSNQAGGAGVVHGFDVSVRGESLRLEPGLAIDPQGRVLLLGAEAGVPIAELVAATRRLPQLRLQPGRAGVRAGFDECEPTGSAPTAEPLGGTRLYLVTLAHAEALCGEEDVYGKLCEEACVTSTARPYRLEGVVLRLRPLQLRTPYRTSGVVALRTRPHLRSLVAAAYFADEADRIASHVSGPGLRGGGWCRGAEAADGVDVPIALLAMQGSGVLFLDTWTARRERIEPPPRRFWAARLAMRPWDVFLAHLLQFQCQLMSVLRQGPGDDPDDPCESERDALRLAADSIRDLKLHMARLDVQEQGVLRSLRVAEQAGPSFSDQLQRVLGLDDRLIDVLQRRRLFRGRRVLIDGGIVELPSAGYLPIDPQATESLESQVRRLMGEGVDLRFCAVRADYVPHALEEAQHMERIDLLHGLEHRDRRPRVDVLVPDGWVEDDRRPPQLNGFEMSLGALPEQIRTPADQFVPAPGQASVAAPNQPVAGGIRLDSMVSGGLTEEAGAVAGVFAGGSRTRGVARTERVGADGGAIFLAGTEAPRQVGTIQTVIRGLEAFARAEERREPAAAAAEPVADRFVRAFGAALRQDAPEVFEAARRAAPAAAKPASRSSGTSSARTSETAEPAPQDGTAAPGAIRLEPLPISRAAMQVEQADGAGVLWGTARFEADPFGLQPGQSTDVSLRVVTGRQGQDAAVELSLRGRLTVMRPVRTVGAVRTLGVSLDARARFEMTRDGTTLCFSAPFRPNLELERLEQATVTAVRVRHMFTPQIGVVALAHWPASAFGSDAQLLLGLTSPQETVYVWGMGLRRSASVFDPVNTLHQAAAGAIDALGAVLVEPGFAEREKKNLFRPEAALAGRRRVRTHRDWVLFHRRREKDCGDAPAAPPQEPPREPPAPPRHRRFVAYLIPSDEKMLGVIRTALAEAPDRLRELQPRRVGVLEYEGGGSRITSSTGVFRTGYEAAGPGPRLHDAVLGARGEAARDDESLSRARLAALAGILPPTTHADAQTQSRILPALAGALDPEDADGVILLVTDLPVRVVLHEVAYMQDFSNPQLEQIRREGLADFSNQNLVRLAKDGLLYRNGLADDADLAAVRQEFQQMFPNRALRTVLVIGSSDEVMLERMDEAAQMAQRFGIPRNAMQWSAVPNLPPGADAVQILV